MLYLYTFAVYIRKHSIAELIKCLRLMIHSLDTHVKEYTLIIYTNFSMPPDIQSKSTHIIREYYDKTEQKVYTNTWLNLSFNKINIFKDLYDEYGICYTWIDLDTIIASDISYVANLPNCFVENGGLTTIQNTLFSNTSDFKVPRNQYIQGNFWKLNNELYEDLMKTFRELSRRNLQLRYDLQDLFSYYLHFVEKHIQPLYILGNTCMKHTINGLAVWKEDGYSHANMRGLEKMYRDDAGILRSYFYPDKEIHIVSFTFETLRQLWDARVFKHVFLLAP